MNSMKNMRFSGIEELAARVRRCRRCVLWKTRRKAIPGEGPSDAAVMFIGEAPGKREDETGRPFVGPAGKFFDKMLAESGISREEVFITSTVKCIPVESRKPAAESIDACNPYLREQLRLIRPRIVCLLGGVAAGTLLGCETVRGFRGHVVERDGVNYLVTYHPSAARRFPQARAFLKRDLAIVSERMRG